MNKFFVTLFIALLPVIFHAQTVQVTVDVADTITEISPYIYGLNHSTGEAFPDYVKALRLGGNRWSGYNWENNASNAGKDLNNISDAYLNGGSGVNSKPANAITQHLIPAKKNKQFVLATLPLAGYVAADFKGAVSTSEIAPSARWKKVISRKGEPFTLSPDLKDSAVYIDEFVNFMVKTQGSSNEFGLNAYSICNEPDFWSSTHPRLRYRKPVTYKELITGAIEYGKIVKELDSNAMIFGPTTATWNNLNHLDFAADRQEYSKYKWFVDAYLDSIAKASNVAGVRLLDVFGFNYYPETTSGGQRIIWSGVPSIDTSEGICAARLQAPRSMWDNNYVEVNPYNPVTAMNIIPKLKQSIDTYFPETKIAITEFEYGAEYHISGGLVLVDLLGVWGREGLFLATKWHGLDIYSELAYKLYLNYDGNSNEYGNLALKSVNSNDSLVSTFASLDENGKLHIIIVNKANTSTQIAYTLQNGLFDSVSVYGFDAKVKTIKQYSDFKIADFKTFSYTLPAWSATHFVCSPAEYISLTKANVDALEGNKINLDFSMTLQNGTIGNEIINGIDLQVEGKTIAINQIDVSAENGITLVLSETISADAQDIRISFDNVKIIGENNLSIKNISNFKVYNLLEGADVEIAKLYTDTDGLKIFVELTKPVESGETELSFFNLKVNNVDFEISNLLTQNSVLEFQLNSRINKNDTLLLSYNGIGITPIDGSPAIAMFSDLEVSNYGTNVAPIIDTVKCTFYGNELEICFNKYMQNYTVSDAGLKLYVNDTLWSFTGTHNYRTTTLLLEKPIRYNSKIKLIYDNDIIKSIDGGYLNPTEYSSTFSTPYYVYENLVVPGKVECENIYYTNSNKFVTESNTTDTYIYELFKGDIYRYNVDVKTSGKYTLLVNSIGLDGTIINIKAKGVAYDSLYLPITKNFTDWLLSGVVLELNAGNQIVEIEVVSSGNRIDYIDFVQGEIELPKIEFSNGFVSSDGMTITAQFNRYWGIIPLINEIIVDENLEKVSLENISFTNDKLVLTLTEPIMKGSKVMLGVSSSTAKSREGASMTAFANAELWNKSSVKTDIDKVEDLGILIFPNPSDNGNLLIESNNSKIDRIDIYGILGSIIFSIDHVDNYFYNLSIENFVPAEFSNVFISVYCTDGKKYDKLIQLK
ncbi:MAG: hypothetical protein IPO21_13445 [Bacteroidales bacterium]|nr:hypothetical protein [Bacteroidales bacterium]